jgi:prepilin-type N-terminal cleavage/methylation domain-containing protein
MKLTLKSAFTLVELLVVITIIAILSTGGTAVYTAQLQKARDTNRFTDIQAFRSGVEQYFTENASYPKATSAATGVTVYMG